MRCEGSASMHPVITRACAAEINPPRWAAATRANSGASGAPENSRRGPMSWAARTRAFASAGEIRASSPIRSAVDVRPSRPPTAARRARRSSRGRAPSASTVRPRSGRPAQQAPHRSAETHRQQAARRRRRAASRPPSRTHSPPINRTLDRWSDRTLCVLPLRRSQYSPAEVTVRGRKRCNQAHNHSGHTPRRDHNSDANYAESSYFVGRSPEPDTPPTTLDEYFGISYVSANPYRN